MTNQTKKEENKVQKVFWRMVTHDLLDPHLTPIGLAFAAEGPKGSPSPATEDDDALILTQTNIKFCK
jgi:hypothetical protein